MAEELYNADFPNLAKLGFKRTSEPAYYNCVSFVVGDLKRKWWPGDYSPFWSVDYWSNGAPKEETVDAFVLALATAGFERCNDGTPEPNVEKAALYALSGVVKHAAVQQVDGNWRSKLGSDEDIEHTLDGLEGPAYGSVIALLKRPRRSPSTP